MCDTNKVSFWELLGKYEIVVPIIQRDYAQGRKGKEELRFRFLSSVYDALSKGDELNLDFVYGGVEKGQMTPLDGQQRLTTLWLIHWYVAFRVGMLEKDAVRLRLKRFYYATRPSSTMFCRRLVDELGKVNPKKVSDTVGYIKSQNWYYSYYENDPTIQAILLMIKGDREQTAQRHEKVKNGLEQFFVGDLSKIWGRLIASDCPIRFFHKDMAGEDTPLVDDLYVKMNARGKQLTQFENFKAELIGYQKSKYLDVITYEQDQQFVSNLDNSWVSVFWPYKHPEYNRVDEIFFRFFNQVMLDYQLIHSDGKDIEKTPLYLLLKDGNAFHKIEDYEEILDSSFKERFFYTMNGLANVISTLPGKKLNEYLEGIIKYYLSFDKVTMSFIPNYNSKDQDEDRDNVPTTDLGQIPRVLFHAICRFFERKDRGQRKDENWGADWADKLADWVRFCYNISYNPIVNTVSSMQGALKLVDEISEKEWCLDIYGELSKMTSLPKLESGVAKDQIEEEYHKAHYQKGNDAVKKMFEEAEQYSFFKGSIRFLIWDEKGSYPTTLDEQAFRGKLDRAKQYFSSNDTLEGKVRNKNCFKSYFRACDKMENILSPDNNGDECIRFNNSGEAWKSMLINKSLCDATHRFLSGVIRSDDEPRKAFADNLAADDSDRDTKIKKMGFVMETALSADFMKDLESMGEIVSGMLFLRKWSEWSLYPKNAKSDKKVLVLGTSRNKVLNELLDSKTIVCKQHEGHLFYGWNVPFKYNGHDFMWNYNHVIVDESGNKVTIKFDSSKDDVLKVLSGNGF